MGVQFICRSSRQIQTTCALSAPSLRAEAADAAAHAVVAQDAIHSAAVDYYHVTAVADNFRATVTAGGRCARVGPGTAVAAKADSGTAPGSVRHSHGFCKSSAVAVSRSLLLRGCRCSPWAALPP